MYLAFILLITLNSFINDIFCVQLTFELPDNAVQCFYERIKKDENTVLEFQVCLLLLALCA